MFERRKVSADVSLKRACNENGLEYNKEANKHIETITLVDKSGREAVINHNLEVVKKNNAGVRISSIPYARKVAVCKK